MAANQQRLLGIVLIAKFGPIDRIEHGLQTSCHVISASITAGDAGVTPPAQARGFPPAGGDSIRPTRPAPSAGRRERSRRRTKIRYGRRGIRSTASPYSENVIPVPKRTARFDRRRARRAAGRAAVPGGKSVSRPAVVPAPRATEQEA